MSEELDRLKGHAAVLAHGSGVTSVELADFQRWLAHLGQVRFMTVGARDYGGERQKFEGMNVESLVDGYLEEVADAINYMTMASIKILAATARPKMILLENACAE